jgi:hypothetical protein
VYVIVWMIYTSGRNRPENKRFDDRTQRPKMMWKIK